MTDCCLLSSVLCPLSSGFGLLSSVLCPLSSGFGLLSSVFCLPFILLSRRHQIGPQGVKTHTTNLKLWQPLRNSSLMLSSGMPRIKVYREALQIIFWRNHPHCVII
jgi:hypothetical protein